MRNFIHSVQLKHLFTEKDDYESIKKAMKLIGDELKKHYCFNDFDTYWFYKIPKDTPFQTSLEAANSLLNRLYDFADERRIWIH